MARLRQRRFTRRKCRNRPQQSFAVAERNSELFEVAVGEIGEHIHIDLTVSKLILVLPEAEIAKPHPHVHGPLHMLWRMIAQGWQAVQLCDALRAKVRLGAKCRNNHQELGVGKSLGLKLSFKAA
jgi:hypothetical protein